MHIREGDSSHTMVSDVKVLQIHATQGEKSATFEKELYFSTMTGNSLTQSLSVGDKKVNPAVKSLAVYAPTIITFSGPDHFGSRRVPAG